MSSSEAQERKRAKQRELVERRMEKQRIARENKMKEEKWAGRAGGMSAKSPPQEKTSRRRREDSGTLPPLHKGGRKVQLSASAPNLNRDFEGEKDSVGERVESKTIEPNALNSHIARATQAAEEILGSNNNSGNRSGGAKRKKSTSTFNEALMKSPLMQPAGFKSK